MRVTAHFLILKENQKIEQQHKRKKLLAALFLDRSLERGYNEDVGHSANDILAKRKSEM